MINFVVFDFDGVFTNGKCYSHMNKTINKYYDVKDGLGLSMLKKNGIITGLISSYSSTYDVSLNNQNIDDIIVNHLSFDYKALGKNNKLSVLNEWLAKTNLSYENVAYIGDDLNDIEIMRVVKFSSCPSDASIQCKESVNYICKNKGGDGCVREFIEHILYNKTPNILQEIKKEINYQIDSFNIEQIRNVSNLIHTNKQNIYFTGVGKSGNIAKHCCDLLKCVNIKAFYLDTLNSLHGDIGSIQENDLMLMFSKSGCSIELVNIIPFLKQKNIYIIGICCEKNSYFSKHCNMCIEIPLLNEMSGIISKIPTNSCVSQLLFSNILITMLKKYCSKDKYSENHPSGNIGKCMQRIKDIMTDKFPKIVLNNKECNIDVHTVLLEMTDKKMGCCFFINTNKNLIGILTDGDIRRFLTTHNENYINIKHINTQYVFETDINKFIDEVKVRYLPIIINNQLTHVVST